MRGPWSKENESFTLTAVDRRGVAIPINTQVATRHKVLGERTGLGVGTAGDPAFTLQAGHEHGVAALTNRGIYSGKETETLRAQSHGAIPMVATFKYREQAGAIQAHTSGGETELCVDRQMTVRRLTPLECERLQGYPDGWTDMGEWTDSKGKKRQTTDTARYKALGNSIALPFWFWLLRRISAQYERPATLGSLFDGIGGFPLCWERCNGKGTAIWASEIEEFPIAVTKRRFGDG